LQSGSTGYADKTGSYTVLSEKVVAEEGENLSCRVQSGFAGY
jgi:hypothetical protein